PVVSHGHNALAEELPLYFRPRLARRLAHRLGRLLDAHVPRRADFCIAVTEELGEILRRRGVAASDLTCIAPAAAPRDAAAHRPRVGSDGLVCYAGNLDGYQNLGFLLRSFARVRARVAAARRAVGDPRAWDGVLDRIEAVYRNLRAARGAARTTPETHVSTGLPMALPE